MTVKHYENFPVASLLLPKTLRQPIATIYAFARSTDDLADEGDALPEERLTALASYEADLNRIAVGERPENQVCIKLAKTIAQHHLPLDLFYDLLSAFKQDVTTSRYPNFVEVLDYCRRSANPIGRLLLALYKVPFGAHREKRLKQADCICSALQLINFCQDVAIDFAKNRIYLPQNEMQQFGVTEAMLQQGTMNLQWRALMAFQVQRYREMMLQGAPLALALPGRIGFELRLVVQGGLRILEKIERVNYDVFTRRPVLRRWDWVVMVFRAFLFRQFTISP